MAEEGPKTCERCGGELRRILHPAGIIFKGSGFYKTDSRQASPAGDSAKKDTATKPAEGKAEPSTAGDTPKADSSATGSDKQTSAKSEPAAATD